MSYTSNGKIPEKYILRPSYDLGKQGYFKGSSYENDDFSKVNSLIENNKKLYAIVSYIGEKKQAKNDIVVENKPVKLKLIQVTNNTSGRYGTNYPFRAMTSDNRNVVVSSDVVLDAITNCGLDEEGFFNCEFVVVSGGNYLNFIRKYSKAYQACVKNMELLKMPKLNSKEFDFEFGNIYKTNSGKYGVFLGYVSTNKVSLKTNFDHSNLSLKKLIDYKVSIKKATNSTLWYTTYNYEMENLDKLKENILAGLKNQSYYYRSFKLYVGAKHNYVLPTDFKINLESPGDIISSIPRKYILEARTHIKNMEETLKQYNSGNRNGYGYYGYRRPENKYIEACNHIERIYKSSEFLNMGPLEASSINSIFKEIEDNILPRFKV